MVFILFTVAHGLEVLPSSEEHGADKDGQDNLESPSALADREVGDGHIPKAPPKAVDGT